jgi:hypothetical protein
MNATTEPVILDLEPIGEEPKQDQPANLPAIAANSPAGLMLAAMRENVPLEQIEKMMDLQERWERREAEKAFNEAMAAFKGEAVEIIKRKQVDFANKSGGRTQYKHAELSDVIEAAAPALSKHGFSWSWKTKQGNGFMEVTCTLKHRLGHSESVSMSGPYDDSGGKNAIQAIVSSKTYLERHTLKAICGLAEKGEDDDGQSAARSLLDTWVDLVNGSESEDALNKVYKDGGKAFTKAKDVEGYKQFASEVNRRRRELKGAR